MLQILTDCCTISIHVLHLLHERHEMAVLDTCEEPVVLTPEIGSEKPNSKTDGDGLERL